MRLHHQEIGCLVGALSNLWVGDRLGRRRTIVLGGCIMIIGAILQTTSYSYAQLVVARIVTGVGNGLNVGISSLLDCSVYLF
jgi:MFS family permease